MAKKVGLDGMYSLCYYNPTLQAHSTASALFSRMKLGKDNQMSFDDSAQHSFADSALMGAHHIILYVLDREDDYFKMGLQINIQRCFEDFKLAWGQKKT